MNNQNDPREHYAIRTDDGHYLHHIPHHLLERYRPGDTVTLTSNGQPLTPTPGLRHWWTAEQPVTGPLTVHWTPYPKTIGYQLSDPTDESKQFPATITPAQHSDMRHDFGDVMYRLYDPVNEQQPKQHETLTTGPWRTLEGAPPPAEDDPRWVVDLPASLTNYPEYRWWLPGKLGGLYDAVEAHAKRKRTSLFGVGRSTAQYDGVEGHLRVEIDVPFARPVTRQKTTDWRGKKLKRPETVQETVKRKLVLPVPTWVHGDSYADALADWTAQFTFWTDLINSETGVKACNHCGGHGYIPNGAEKYTPAPASREN
ncbi:hypothetical protein [Kitasatospora sp. NPDC087315]|uniref:hypothetical protein n=1 Tax=Kitasatospora sp. NPDC087315 TaxID=3364069 RepID=UPI0037F76D2F